MKTAKELRARRAALHEQARALLNTAEAGDRDFTADEKRQWDGWQNEMEQLGHRAERLEQEERDRRGADPVARAIFGEGAAQRDDSAGETWLDPRSGREVRVLEQRESFALGLREEFDPELRGLTLGGWLRSLATGPRTSAERRALSEGSGGAGGYTVPSILMPGFVDRLRAATAIFQAGARTVPLESDEQTMARLATDPTAIWHVENTSENASDPTFEQISFSTKTLMAIVRASRELAMDSVNIDQMLQQAFINSFRAELDRVALEGASASGEPVGLSNIAGVGNVLLSATLTSYDPILNAIKEVLIDNGPMPRTIIVAPRDWVTLQKLKDGQNQPLQVPPALQNMQMLIGGNVPTDGGSPQEESRIYVGDFRRMLVGVRSSVQVDVLRERYADSYQLGFLAHMRVDIQVEHPAAFAMVTKILP